MSYIYIRYKKGGNNNIRNTMYFDDRESLQNQSYNNTNINYF